MDGDAGAALWSDPGTTWRLQFNLGQIRAVFGSFGLRQVARGVRTQMQLDKLHPTEPHGYLGFLGVRESRRDQGRGSALLEEVLTRADDAKAPAYVAVAATYGYQDEPDVVAALRQAQRQGLEIDLDRTSYYVDHVTILPTGRARMAGWRKRLFAVLHQNSTPVARSYGIPPDRVFEVGAYVEL